MQKREAVAGPRAATLAHFPLGVLSAKPRHDDGKQNWITEEQREVGLEFQRAFALRTGRRPVLGGSPALARYIAEQAGEGFVGGQLPEHVIEEATERWRAMSAALRAKGRRVFDIVVNIAVLERWPLILTAGPGAPPERAHRELDALKEGLDTLMRVPRHARREDRAAA